MLVIFSEGFYWTPPPAKIDADSSGAFDIDEVREAFELAAQTTALGAGSTPLGQKKRRMFLGQGKFRHKRISTPELVAMMSSVDEDGSGLIEFDEFLLMMQAQANKVNPGAYPPLERAAPAPAAPAADATASTTTASFFEQHALKTPRGAPPPQGMHASEAAAEDAAVIARDIVNDIVRNADGSTAGAAAAPTPAFSVSRRGSVTAFGTKLYSASGAASGEADDAAATRRSRSASSASERADGLRGAYYCLQTRSPARWDQTGRLTAAVLAAGCRILDSRCWHPPAPPVRGGGGGGDAVGGIASPRIVHEMCVRAAHTHRRPLSRESRLRDAPRAGAHERHRGRVASGSLNAMALDPSPRLQRCSAACVVASGRVA